MRARDQKRRDGGSISVGSCRKGVGGKGRESKTTLPLAQLMDSGSFFSFKARNAARLGTERNMKTKGGLRRGGGASSGGSGVGGSARGGGYGYASGRGCCAGGGNGRSEGGEMDVESGCWWLAWEMLIGEKLCFLPLCPLQKFLVTISGTNRCSAQKGQKFWKFFLGNVGAVLS